MKPEVTLNQALDAFDPTTADPQGRATRARSILERMEALVTSGELHRTEAGVLARYLDSTRRSSFLVALGGPEERRRWAETTFEAIRASRYTLETMLDQRVAAHPDRVMFGEAQNTGGTWTYAQVRRRIRLIAASFLGDVTGDPHPAPRRPRVAILADNSVDAACCDLACLVHDIFVAPISVHFDAVTVAALFDKLEIDRAVCDSELLYLRLLEVRKLGRARFRIYNLGEATHLAEDGDIPLAMGFSHLGQETVDELIRNRPRFSLDDDATVLFTSGSTGLPKGVVFSQFNLVSKRFARAAALPRVGDDEVFLCYLPLFHTFGRYLELLGTLFWGGTYAFAGNPSAETLIALLERVRPTALISIPLRWVQIREECLRRMDATTHPEERRRVFSETVGGRLSWGLSAAGHLDARVFHFFNDHGVRLCSGFGMTEATGGITMTPPGQYQDDSVGVPLPGVKIRLSDEGELHISGPYVARYLDDPRPAPGEEHWLATGDVFVLGEGGHLQIVDKIKDLYKNTKGQTIAPRRVEQKYADVPGIKRVFLVGDGRDHNVLLIVPDRDDEVLKKAATTGMVDGYFRQIVRAANRDLAAYERVVNFALLDRDLSLQRDELTPKGSYRRKAIEEHFQEIIGDLYRQKHVDVTVDSLTVRIPRWLIRDLGILENDIVADGSTLVNLQNRRSLTVRRGEASGRVRVGDLEYEIRTGTVDLGTFSRQPMLWAGNPSLVAFCACKDGWDLSLGEISPQIFLVRGGDPGDQPAPAPLEHLPNDPRLRCLHDVSVSIFFGPVG
ncbi:MAG: AMP-binding protein [Candidatus Riflebacteria bacterium]|nr:AMP-binding protein [Candidatus Riflebacteria bacterium]